MSRLNMFNMSVLLLTTSVGVYTGLRFFEPIVVERLRQDGNLRKDFDFPEYDDEGNPIIPEVEEIRKELSDKAGLNTVGEQGNSEILQKIAELDSERDEK